MGDVQGRKTNEIYYQEREASIFDVEYAWKTDDVAYWVELGREYAGNGGNALELGCGTGRILIPMAENGITVVGVDQSPWMIAKAKEKYDRLSEPVASRIGLLEGDMRTLKLEQKFNLIYIPFNSFQVIRTIEEQLTVFEVVRRHLAPGGVFAFDVFVPDLKRLVKMADQSWTLEVDETLGELGTRFVREYVQRVDPIQQLLMITFRMKEYEDNVLVREWLSDLDLTYIFPRELEHLVARAGFEFVHFWGDYDRTDFRKMHGPTKQLPVLRPKA